MRPLRPRLRAGVVVPRLDGLPRRAYSAVNARHEEKRLFDHLHSWWNLNAEHPLSQVDAFSRVLALALEHPKVDAPADIARSVAQKREDGSP